MPNTLQKPRIQQAIVAALRAGPFYVASYAPYKDTVPTDTGYLADVDEGASPTVLVPVSVKVNEVRSSFGPATRLGLRTALDRKTWDFLAEVSFTKEVLCERFEENFADSPACLPPSGSLPPVQIALGQVVYQHPTTHHGPSGTKLQIHFSATVGRR